MFAINSVKANNLYIGGGFGVEDNQYSGADKKIGGALKGFLGYEFKNLNIELGYNYGFEKDASTRIERIAYNNSDFYIELAPKYNINEEHSLLLITGVSQINQSVDIRQGVLNPDALEGEIITNTGSLSKQSDTAYSIGLGYAYNVDSLFSLSLKYKYNMPKELEKYSSLSFNIAFNLNELRF